MNLQIRPITATSTPLKAKSPGSSPGNATNIHRFFNNLYAHARVS